MAPKTVPGKQIAWISASVSSLGTGFEMPMKSLHKKMWHSLFLWNVFLCYCLVEVCCFGRIYCRSCTSLLVSLHRWRYVREGPPCHQSPGSWTSCKNQNTQWFAIGSARHCMVMSSIALFESFKTKKNVKSHEIVNTDVMSAVCLAASWFPGRTSPKVLGTWGKVTGRS